MRRTPLRILVLACALALALSLAGCGEKISIGIGGDGRGVERDGPGRGHGPPDHAPAHGYRAKYKYYPDSEVYYDTNRGLYFYYEDGEWHASVSLPRSITLGTEYVTMELDTDKPYTRHGEHTEKYPPGQGKNKGKGKAKGKNKDKW
jgi:hypothetical protein